MTIFFPFKLRHNNRSILIFVYFDFTAQIQQMKHGVPKGDKKRKKEVQAEIAKLEAALDAKQEEELKNFKARGDLQEKVIYTRLIQFFTFP